MTTREFIFSNQTKYRLGRHLVFWAVFSLHFIIQNLMVGGPGEAKSSRTFLESAGHFLYFLPIYFVSTFLVIQVLLPRFLFRQRYGIFAFLFLALFLLTFVLIYYAGLISLSHTTGKSVSQVTFSENKYHTIVNGLFVPFMLFGIAAGIKFSKNWFLQQQENKKLEKQKLATELQILKTSIHPRFLFHSLHTVEKHINSSSLQSPSLILQLSDLLSYILYENDKNWVALEKELEVVRGYINLQEKSFDGKLLLTTEFPKDATGAFIIPCVLLSFIESSFEYFHETGQQEPLLDVAIKVSESTLHFQMTFSKPAGGTDLPNERIGRIQKQLLSQYHDLQQLGISSTGENISIDLKLPLYSAELVGLKKNTMKNEVPQPA